MNPQVQLVTLLRGEIANILAGAFFLFIALTALAIAAIRPRRSARLLLWLGIWSGMYGEQELLRSQAVAASLPGFMQNARQALLVFFAYFIIVAATLAFLELTSGILRRILQIHLAAGLVVAIVAMALYAMSGSQNSLVVHNESLVVILLAALVLTLLVPGWSRRFLTVSQHRVLTIGTFVFAAQALWVNIARGMNIRVPPIYNTLGFAIFLLAIGYTGIAIMIADERRLLVLDEELAVARRLQFSILPACAPQVPGLAIAATYQPMSAVAGDFYAFLAAADRHVGVLVADVSGHGVPAALIASMIKVATQAAALCADNPAEVLRSLGAILYSNARGQLVSASYLWLDMASHTATYSAAGHPPLLRWRKQDGTFTRIESNGLLFGINAEAEYPVCTLPLLPGDRFLLYTDGVTEPENSAEQAFGESRLEEVVRAHQSRSASELCGAIAEQVRVWQPAGALQQDDITLVVLDVLE